MAEVDVQLLLIELSLHGLLKSYYYQVIADVLQCFSVILLKIIIKEIALHLTAQDVLH
jgi:hypothetical protein